MKGGGAGGTAGGEENDVEAAGGGGHGVDSLGGVSVKGALDGVMSLRERFAEELKLPIDAMTSSEEPVADLEVRRCRLTSC